MGVSAPLISEADDTQIYLQYLLSLPNLSAYSIISKDLYFATLINAFRKRDRLLLKQFLEKDIYAQLDFHKFLQLGIILVKINDPSLLDLFFQKIAEQCLNSDKETPLLTTTKDKIDYEAWPTLELGILVKAMLRFFMASFLESSKSDEEAEKLKNGFIHAEKYEQNDQPIAAKEVVINALHDNLFSLLKFIHA